MITGARREPRRRARPRRSRPVRRLAAWVLLAAAATAVRGAAPLAAQDAGAVRRDRGRVTVWAYPHDAALASAVLDAASAATDFPGLPPASRRVTIAIAPDARRFRAWAGAAAPEWGSAVAFGAEQRIVMQGRAAGSRAGDPLVVLRHELAHLALDEALPDAEVPRWFHEGYASLVAREVRDPDALVLPLALAARRTTTYAALDSAFLGGEGAAAAAYALALRAVEDLARRDASRGLGLLFRHWHETGRLEPAVRRAYGVTLARTEAEWAARMRRRYGALAVAMDLGIAGAGVSVLLLPLGWWRRRRTRARLAAMREAEARAEERAETTGDADADVPVGEAIEALLASVPPAAPTPRPPADGARAVDPDDPPPTPAAPGPRRP